MDWLVNARNDGVQCHVSSAIGRGFLVADGIQKTYSGVRVEGTWDFQDLSMLLNFEIFSKFRADSAAYRCSIRAGIICRGRKRCLTIISDVPDAR